MLVYVWDRSAQTVVRAATLRYKLQIKLAFSPDHDALTLGRPVLAQTLYRQAPGRVAPTVSVSTSFSHCSVSF